MANQELDNPEVATAHSSPQKLSKKKKKVKKIKQSTAYSISKQKIYLNIYIPL